MKSVLEIPEVAALNAPQNIIRIPNQIDVPVTKRIMQIVDTAEFQRLSRISQLGLVSTVYPAANHSRFEHSLGVYRMTLMVLRQLGANQRFNEIVSAEQGVALLLAGLLHDLGHWPFCHPIEDIGMRNVPAHETVAGDYIRRGEIGKIINDQFNLNPETVIGLIERRHDSIAESLLCSILSGPIDVDKLDYLYRDSLHAGVPYGQNFDTGRLIGSLCLNERGDKLAITDKGRTAAELMVFARYVMFSEVYWHHAVRSATAMLQRSFYLVSFNDNNAASQLFRLDDAELISQLMRLCADTEAEPLLVSLFGPTRQLYKRLVSYSFMESPEIYRALAQQPYPVLVEKSQHLGSLIAQEFDLQVKENEVLIDAPPIGLEVQFDVDVFYPRSNTYRSLGEVSPVVSTLANRQFDDFVKQVRVFVHPRLKPRLANENVATLITRIIA